MKALVFEQPRSAAVRELDVPTIAPDEVLVRSRNVGICHSDFELYEGRYIIPISYPIIPGHEWSGEIAEVGERVTSLKAGDRVVGECVVNGGDDHFGFSISGANAEYFVAKATWLHRIPEELSFAQGAFVEPFSVAYNRPDESQHNPKPLRMPRAKIFNCGVSLFGSSCQMHAVCAVSPSFDRLGSLPCSP